MTDRKFVIAYLIDGLSLGGAERLMIPILKNLDRQVFEPHVCFMQDRDGSPMAAELRAAGVPVDFLPVSRLRDVTAIPRLRAYLRRIRADLVHTQLEFADILGVLAAKSLGLPCVSTLHTIPAQDQGFKASLHQRLEVFVRSRGCDVVIAVSEETRLFHLDLSGVAPEKIQTIYNGIDLAGFADIKRDATRAAIRAELGLPDAARVLITVAVLRELKGIRFMLQALPAILNQHPETYYLIVGSGDDRPNLEQAAQGLAGRVIFTGRRSDIPRLLAAADVFVLPTLTEALPTVLAEAMAARLPVIASAVGGVPEMVTDGINGLLTQPANEESLTAACCALLADPARCAALAEAGFQVAHKKFDIHAQVENLKTLYLKWIRAYEK